VRNAPVLRSSAAGCHTAVDTVEISPSHSPAFSASRGRSWNGPSEVLRMIRSPYSYNLLFLKKKVMMVAPRSSTA
jgi:hypothetical protein